MQQENATHLGTATYVLCSGEPSTQIVEFLLLFLASDANVPCVLTAAFEFPVTIKWISVL